MNLNVNSVEASILVNYVYSSIAGSLIPMILAALFAYHTPTIAVHSPSKSLYEVIKDKYLEKKFERDNRKRGMRLDTNQIEFDILGLMTQKDINSKVVSGHSKLKGYNFKQLFTKEELFNNSIERHVKTGKTLYRQESMSESSNNGDGGNQKTGNGSSSGAGGVARNTIAYMLQMVRSDMNAVHSGTPSNESSINGGGGESGFREERINTTSSIDSHQDMDADPFEIRQLTTSRSSKMKSRTDLQSYLKRKVSFHTLRVNHGRVLLSHMEQSNQIVVEKTPTIRREDNNYNNNDDDADDNGVQGDGYDIEQASGNIRINSTSIGTTGDAGDGVAETGGGSGAAINTTGSGDRTTSGEAAPNETACDNILVVGGQDDDNSGTGEESEIITLSDADHAILMLIQSHLIETRYWFHHISLYIAWILGTLWILGCCAIIIIYGVNFDLASELEAADMDTIESFSPTVMVTDDISSLQNMIYNYNCSDTFDNLYRTTLEDKVDYRVSLEYTENNTRTSIFSCDDMWEGVADSESWLLSFLLSFLISIVIWTPISTLIIAFLQAIMYKFVWHDYHKPNSYYTQSKYSNKNDIGFEMEYVNIKELENNLNNEIQTEDDLWQYMGNEISVKALCQYPFWVLQHPYVKRLRRFLDETNN